MAEEDADETNADVTADKLTKATDILSFSMADRWLNVYRPRTKLCMKLFLPGVTDGAPFSAAY